MLAFRCKTCGHLHPAEHAGESDLPHGCVVCGAGVAFSPRGIKSLDPDNWEVLADATPERLEELGLESKHVARHEGTRFPPTGRTVERTASEGVSGEDRAS
jgi:predicted  nucleic acid-binding Zn-ribbon protein